MSAPPGPGRPHGGRPAGRRQQHSRISRVPGIVSVLGTLAVATLVLRARLTSRHRRRAVEGEPPSYPMAPPAAAPSAWPKRRAQMAAATFIVTAAVGGSGLAWAAFSGSPTAETNTFTAGSLSQPGAPTAIHPNVTGSSDGNVALTWSAPLSRAVTVLVQRAPASTPTTWATVNGGGSGQPSSTLCTGSVPGTVSCTYTDSPANSTSAPVYGQQYLYQVLSVIGGWNAPSAGVLSESLQPTVGSETYMAPPDIEAVSASSSTAVWAVGRNCTVLYSAGTGTWVEQTVSTVCPAGTTLYGVSADGGKPMIVGANGVTFLCTASCTAAAPTWAAKSTAALGSPTLYAVSASSTKAMWAVGPDCAVLGYNGNGWAALTVPSANCPAGTTLNGVDADGGHPLVVGDAGVLFHCTGGTCVSSPTWSSPTVSRLSGSPGLYGAGSSGNSAAWVVGANGTLIICSSACQVGGTWTQQAAVTSVSLQGVAAVSTSVVYVVGASGTILKCTSSCTATSSTWSTVSSSTTVALTAAAAPATSAVFSVGAAGTITFSSGTDFALQSSGLGATQPVSTTLAAGDLTALGAPDGSLYADIAAWPAGTLPTSCAGTTSQLLLQAAPVVPSGTWSVTSAIATVVLQADATPGTGAGFALLASNDGGSTWSSYALTSPGTGGAAATTSVNVLPTISSTTALQSLQLCLVGTSGSGAPITTSVDLVHLDVN